MARDLRSPALAVVLTSLAPLAWGSTYAVTTELLPPDRPLFSAMVRSLVPGLVGLALVRRLPRGRGWLPVVLLAAFNIGFFFPLLFAAAYRLPGGVASVLNAGVPLVVALLSGPLLARPATGGDLLRGFAGILGVGLIVQGGPGSLDALGVVAGLGAMLSLAMAVTLGKRWDGLDDVGPWTMAAWQLCLGGVLLLPFALAEGPPPPLDGPAVAGYTWLGLVGGLVAYAFWFTGLGQLPATTVAFLGLLAPVVALGIGLVVLGEQIAVKQLTGAAMLGAVVVWNRAEMTRQPP